ncbi:MAG: hypothetical protein WCI36_05365 [bacterium]
MKIILFRFEKEKINFIECDIDSGNLIIGNKDNMPLESAESRGEKYNKVLDEFLHLWTKYPNSIFAYQAPQRYMGAIKDVEGFANASMLHLFCYQNSIDILELTSVSVREKLSIPNKDFKTLLEKEKISVCEKYKIAKSDKILDGLVSLSLLSETF